jgi:hypothetical protein
MLVAAVTLGGLGCGGPSGHPSNPDAADAKGATDARTGSAGGNAAGAAGAGGATGTAGDDGGAAAAGAGADAAPGSDSGAIPGDYATLCARSACPCQTGSAPPRLVGSYSGQGTTKETSNSLWVLNASAQLVVHVTSQPGDGTIAGTAQVSGASDAGASDAGASDAGASDAGASDGGAMSFALPLTSASILGSGSNFTIYGTDLEDTGGGCKHGVRAVLSGTVSADSTINGCAAVVFTAETQGSACTASEVANYPGTGATFQYSVRAQ